MEPVHGEREGLHRLAALDRAGDVALRPLGRRAGGPAPRPLARPDRLHAGAHLHQPHDGRARGAGRGDLRAVDRLAGDPQAVALGRRSSLAAVVGDLAQLHLPADPGGAVPAHQRGRADRLLQPGAERRPQPGAVRQAAASSQRQADFVSQFQNYWQYWSWQFARDWGGWSRIATALFTVARRVRVHHLLAHQPAQRRRWPLVFFFTLVPLLMFYLNFKYGYSMHPEQPDLAARGARARLLLRGVVRRLGAAGRGRDRRAHADRRRQPQEGRRQGGAGSRRARCSRSG